jgi:hypothetical protein
MRLILRKPFDPTGEHVAARDMLLGGSWVRRGEAIPSGISPQRLRQLYRLRRIDQRTLPGSVVEGDPPTIAQLRAEAKRRGLPIRGTKAELRQRLAG